MAQILIVEDDPNWLDLYKIELEDDSYTIQTAQTIEESIVKIRSHTFDVVVTDLRLIGDYQGGISLLNLIKKECPDAYTLVIIFTGYGSTELAQKALRSGAYDYLTKPLDYDHAKMTIKAAIEVRAQLIQKASNSNLSKEVMEGTLEFPERFMYSANKMREAVHLAARQAESDDNLLIIGASGTGKSTLAEAIHFGSQRTEFVLINCESYSERTLERNLFGGYLDDEKEIWHPGYLQTCPGTIVLDKVTSLSGKLQSRLLEILTTEQLSIRNDDSHLLPVNARIIALDSQEIRDVVNEGLFSEALFEVFSKNTIEIPQLRDRQDHNHNDVIYLAQYFINKYGIEPYPDLSTEAKFVLTSYLYPGNVRELQLIIRKAILRSKNEDIQLEHLPEYLLHKIVPKGLGLDPHAKDNEILCPHGSFICNQTNEIAQGYTKGNILYFRPNHTTPHTLWDHISHQAKSRGLFLQQHLNLHNSRVVHCRYCLPIQMSHYAIVDIAENDPGIIYEIGLLHTLGIPLLLLKKVEQQGSVFFDSLNTVEYKTPDDVSHIVSHWLSNLNL